MLVGMQRFQWVLVMLGLVGFCTPACSGDDEVRHWLDRLESKDPQIKQDAQQRIAAMGVDAAPALIDALNHDPG